MSKQIINEEVMVTAVSFRRNFDAIPSRIEYKGRSYSFRDAGIRYRIKAGDRISQLFDMTDGINNFRLRHDSGVSGWTLVTMS